MKIVAVILLLVAVATPTFAVCTGPLDARCPPGAFTNPLYGSPAFYAANPLAAQVMVVQCSQPVSSTGSRGALPPPAWCAAARAAAGIGAIR